MEKNGKEQVVRFANQAASISGVVGGVIIALGVPWIILSYGQVLGQTVQTGLVIGSIALGGLITLASAFFGVVIPSHVNDYHGKQE